MVYTEICEISFVCSLVSKKEIGLLFSQDLLQMEQRRSNGFWPNNRGTLSITIHAPRLVIKLPKAFWKGFTEIREPL